MHQAAAHGRLETMRVLIKAGADVNARAGSLPHGTSTGRETPLYEAAFWGKAAMVQFLLKHGADPNLKDAYGRSPLTWAGKEGPIRDLLIQHGAKQ